jgi:DNA integrity scanning protein DisA with diadenylate cyclase activity
MPALTRPSFSSNKMNSDELQEFEEYQAKRKLLSDARKMKICHLVRGITSRISYEILSRSVEFETISNQLMFLHLEYVRNCIKLYLFDKEITKAVKYRYECRYLWKREAKEVLEIKLLGATRKRE